MKERWFKERKIKKWVSLVLALVMVVTLLPLSSVTAYAKVAGGIANSKCNVVKMGNAKPFSIECFATEPQYNSYYLPEGNYYLDNDVNFADFSTIKYIRILSGEIVNFCLHGHAMLATTGVTVFWVEEGATLNLYDCEYEYNDEENVGGEIKGGHGTDEGIGGAIFNKGTVNFYSGNIHDFTVSYGGGAIYNLGVNSVFNMYGGKINDCCATMYGGAICSFGTINMYGGRIESCCNESEENGLGGAIFSTYIFNMMGE